MFYFSGFGDVEWGLSAQPVYRYEYIKNSNTLFGVGNLPEGESDPDLLEDLGYGNTAPINPY
ncbi:MAG: hypothetical protein ABL933_01600 [Methyloglobulus sp.]|nr:hypothetical protein [Methyloglobulus sp.]